jgi:predicted secreted protein
LTTLNPEVLFSLIAHHIPADLHKNILIVGSLAAAYHHREQLQERAVNTKDADVVVQPAGALAECREMALRLLDDNWRRHPAKCFAQENPEPVDDLRAIRLLPPMSDAYYLELLGLPELGQTARLRWVPIELDDGWYGLPCFRYFAVTGHDPERSDEGLPYATPAMMALANLLAHPMIGEQTMSEPIGGQMLLRSSKDLGRVLALAWLAGAEGIENWLQPWRTALRRCYPQDHEELARCAGGGLRALLEDDAALEHARVANEVGLLHGKNVDADNLRAVGAQVLTFAIDPLDKT